MPYTVRDLLNDLLTCYERAVEINKMTPQMHHMVCEASENPLSDKTVAYLIYNLFRGIGDLNGETNKRWDAIYEKAKHELGIDREPVIDYFSDDE